MKKKIIAMRMAALALSATFVFAGCDKDNSTTTVTVTGSTSVGPVMATLAAAYEKAHDDVKIVVSTSDSSTGITDTQSGKNDFGMASRSLKSNETGVTSQQIATDGVALIVNTECSVEDVSATEIYDLFANGTSIQNTITQAITRESGSGTRDAFDDLISNGTDKLKNLTSFATCVQEQSSTSGVKLAVSTAGNTNLLGYISLGSVDSTVKTLKFAGVTATVDNVKNGTYKLSRPFNIILRENEDLSATAQAFVDYIMSSEGQAIIEEAGYVSVI